MFPLCCQLFSLVMMEPQTRAYLSMLSLARNSRKVSLYCSDISFQPYEMEQRTTVRTYPLLNSLVFLHTVLHVFDCGYTSLHTHGQVSAHRHAGTRMAITTRSRCMMRLNTSPSLFIQPYL
jgi:hypothetical protein